MLNRAGDGIPDCRQQENSNSWPNPQLLLEQHSCTGRHARAERRLPKRHVGLPIGTFISTFIDPVTYPFPHRTKPTLARVERCSRSSVQREFVVRVCLSLVLDTLATSHGCYRGKLLHFSELACRHRPADYWIDQQERMRSTMLFQKVVCLVV